MKLGNVRVTVSAWLQLSRFEEDKVWAKIYDRLAFNPSVYAENFPGFAEPAPSVTYSFRDIWGEEFSAINSDLEKKALTIFRQATRPDDFIYALDWQHACYKFYPHRVDVSDSNDWLIPPLANGDYHIFVEKSLSYGWLGHPWEQTICLFGQPILAALKNHRPQIFRNPVRRRDAS